MARSRDRPRDLDGTSDPVDRSGPAAVPSRSRFGLSDCPARPGLKSAPDGTRATACKASRRDVPAVLSPCPPAGRRVLPPSPLEDGGVSERHEAAQTQPNFNQWEIGEFGNVSG